MQATTRSFIKPLIPAEGYTPDYNISRTQFFLPLLIFHASAS